MTKEELYNLIHPYFYLVIMAFYNRGRWDECTKEAFENLQMRVKDLGLSAGTMRLGDDIVLFVESSDQYTLVSTKLNLFTYKDDEDDE